MAGLYYFKLQARLGNIERLEPENGPEDTEVSYYFKLRCQRCKEESKSEVAAKMGLKNHRSPTGDPCNMVYTCKFCEVRGWVDLIGLGKALTPADTEVTLMCIRTYGFDLLEPSLNGGFRVYKGDCAENVNLVLGRCRGEFSDGTEYLVSDITVSLVQR